MFGFYAMVRDALQSHPLFRDKIEVFQDPLRGDNIVIKIPKQYVNEVLDHMDDLASIVKSTFREIIELRMKLEKAGFKPRRVKTIQAKSSMETVKQSPKESTSTDLPLDTDEIS